MPMKTYISTLFYSIQGFVTSDSKLLDFDAIADKNNSEYADVYRFLDKSKTEPSKKIVDNILNYSHSGMTKPR